MKKSLVLRTFILLLICALLIACFGPYCTNCVLSQNGDSYSCVIQGGAGYKSKSGEFRDFNDFTMIVDVDAYTGACSSTYEK